MPTPQEEAEIRRLWPDFDALTPRQRATARRLYREREYLLRLEERRYPEPTRPEPSFPLDFGPVPASRGSYVRIAIQGAAAAAALVSTILALLGYWS